MAEAEKNMFEELFIQKAAKGDFLFPEQSREDCQNVLSSDAGAEEKSEAIFSLCETFRCEALKKAGKLANRDCEKLIRLIRSYEKELGEDAGIVLLRQGARSEKFHDYESALKFYEASLRCDIQHPPSRYFRLNNLAFCLNVSCRFDKAEEFLRAATFMDPLRYNAWKNLGVCLEFQKNYEEAAECYFRAVCCSHGERRSVKHFLRLLERQPALQEKYPKWSNLED